MAAADKVLLVIEDNTINMRLFNDLLTSQGYKVLKAMDGAGAWQLAQEHHPDAIVLDIQSMGRASQMPAPKLRIAMPTSFARGRSFWRGTVGIAKALAAKIETDLPPGTGDSS